MSDFLAVAVAAPLENTHAWSRAWINSAIPQRRSEPTGRRRRPREVQHAPRLERHRPEYQRGALARLIAAAARFVSGARIGRHRVTPAPIVDRKRPTWAQWARNLPPGWLETHGYLAA